MMGDFTKRRVRVIASSALGVLLVLSVAILGGYVVSQRTALRAQASRLGALEQQVSSMSKDQVLLAQMVELGTQASTATASTQATVVAEKAPAAPGSQPLFGSVRGASKASYGWELSVDPSEYATGATAFSLASSMGKLTNPDGSFILDTSTRTTKLKLLKDARVTVASWPGAPKGAPHTISASELVAVLPGGASADSTWAKSWFWFDVRDGYVLTVRQQSIE